MRKSGMDRVIKRAGQPWRNLSNGTTTYGTLNTDGPAMFLADSNLRPGDALQAQDGRQFIVDFIRHELQGYQSVCLVRYHLTCSIWTAINPQLDDFGRPITPAFVLSAEQAPIIIHGNRAQVPTAYAVGRGEVLEIQGERYAVLSVSRCSSAGLTDLVLEKQDPNVLASML